MGEFKNMVKGIFCYALLNIIVLLFLRILAGEMSAGSVGFNLMVPFLAAQAITVAACYGTWYFKVNRLVANKMDISEMREIASKNTIKYLAFSVAITLLIFAVAFCVMVMDVLGFGIPAVYCYSSVFIMFILGNVSLILLMKVALPNRVTGSY